MIEVHISKLIMKILRVQKQNRHVLLNHRLLYDGPHAQQWSMNNKEAIRSSIAFSRENAESKEVVIYLQ